MNYLIKNNYLFWRSMVGADLQYVRNRQPVPCFELTHAAPQISSASASAHLAMHATLATLVAFEALALAQMLDEIFI